MELTDDERSSCWRGRGGRSRRTLWRFGRGSCWPPLMVGQHGGRGQAGDRGRHGAEVACPVPGRPAGGVIDEPRPGRPRTVLQQQVEAVITRTLETTLADATHWSTRSLAAELGMSQSAVSRIWRAFGLRRAGRQLEAAARIAVHRQGPRRRRTVPRSPEAAVVLCVDEKSSIQLTAPPAAPPHAVTPTAQPIRGRRAVTRSQRLSSLWSRLACGKGEQRPRPRPRPASVPISTFRT